MSYPSSSFKGWNELRQFITDSVDDGTVILLACRKVSKMGSMTLYQISGTVNPHQPGVFIIAHVEKKEEVDE